METNAQTNIQKSLIICNFECQRGGSGTKLDIGHDTNYANTHNIKKKNGSAVSRTYIDLYGDAQEIFKQPTKIYQKAWHRHHNLYVIAKSGNDSLIPVTLMTKHNEEFEMYKADFIDAVKEVETRFTEMRDNAIVKYNGRLTEEDYPTLEELISKFSWNVKRSTLADANALDNALGSQELEKEIRDEVLENQQKLFNNAVENVVKRFEEHLKNILKQTDNSVGVAETTITNFSVFLKLLPDLNISGCPKIEKACEDAKKLIAMSSNNSASDQLVKEDIAKQSQSILTDLTAIYGG